MKEKGRHADKLCGKINVRSDVFWSGHSTGTGKRTK
jgi:hypothetical protein